MDDITRAHCNRCGHSTNHDVLAVDREEYDAWTSDVEYTTCYDLYEMVKCRGCGAVAIRATVRHIEDREPRIVYYPPAIARRAPKWVTGSFDSLHIPIIVFELMNEVYAAVQNNLLRLAAMGIRAVLENVMRAKIGEQRTFKAFVDEFQKAGYLSMREVASLDSILEAGHAVIHRGWEPSEDDIATLLDITEAVIEKAYLHEARAQALDKRVPRRSKPA